MRLRSKIHLYSSVLFAAVIILMNVSIYAMFWRISTNSELMRAEAEAVTAAAGLREAADTAAMRDLLRAYVPLDGMIGIVDAHGSAEGRVTSAGEPGLSRWQLHFTEERQVRTVHFEGRSFSYASIPVIWSGGEVANIQVMQSMEAASDNLRVLGRVLTAVTLLALLPVFLSSWLLGRLVMRPIQAMTSTMRDIRGSGSFRRLKQQEGTRDELAQMGETFNSMIEQLENNYDKQKSFVSNASHELKTPLTVIESYASLLLRRGKERPELLEESLQAIHSEAVRMKEMTEQLLLLARPKEQWQVSLGQVELGAAAEESAQAFRSAYDRAISVRLPELPVTAWSDAAKLKQLLFILLDNARKYSEDEITVTVAERKGGGAELRVTDRGIGIPKDELPKVFDRFYRVDQSRTRSIGGTGLGLSLGKELAEAIGAELTLESVEGLGTTAVVAFSAKSNPHRLSYSHKSKKEEGKR
ncbi:HAMP domain-containing histidine kinase [Paenibacillus pasadenensis]|uniref:sensor histidine kinase n=1 Tax=Paenibacillus pasadenensis TaxID=217090 RepID=UPI00203D29E4|nr:HAMP domain-containing sensor histidine kinase [Paenibacillus pasadenensis]MCM3750239.1 HAMP domain-containing histidine kinase [Paenibacillus pasadenensis]